MLGQLRCFLNREVAVPVTVVLVIAIIAADYLTGPFANLSILYFLPITYAAWALGRIPAFATALIAEANTYYDELTIAASAGVSQGIAVANIVTRLMVYLFVAEVTFRLARSLESVTQTASRLRELNNDLNAAYRAIGDDIAAAGALQASMIAPSSLKVPGCEVGVRIEYAGQTGGDFVESGMVDRCVYVCVADISGKGTPAALFTALLKYFLGEALRLGLRGGHAIGTMNSWLCRILPPEKFVTLFYAEFDPNTGVVRCVNAGHVEAIILRQETGELELVGPTTGILGVVESDSAAPGVTLHLDPGDAMVLCTDGATESRTQSGGRLGDEVIRRLVMESAGLDAIEMADRITSRLLETAAPGARDDIGIVCLRRTIS